MCYLDYLFLLEWTLVLCVFQVFVLIVKSIYLFSLNFSNLLDEVFHNVSLFLLRSVESVISLFCLSCYYNLCLLFFFLTRKLIKKIVNFVSLKEKLSISLIFSILFQFSITLISFWSLLLLFFFRLNFLFSLYTFLRWKLRLLIRVLSSFQRMTFSVINCPLCVAFMASQK